MSMANGDVVRVTAKMSIDGQAIQNVYHVQNQGAGTLSDSTAFTEIAARLESAYGNIQGQYTTDYDFDSIELFNVTQDVPMIEAAWPTFTSGTNAADSLPFMSAGLIKFTTAAARTQGRKYLGPFNEAAQTGGHGPSSTLQANLASFATSMLAAWLVGSGNLAFGAWSKKYTRFAEFVSPIIHQYWRTQRRRAFGVGS